jgi:hypothetical protein
MSLDLGVFYTVRPHTDEEALNRYISLCGASDRSACIEPSPNVGQFLTELTASYPQIDDVPEKELDACPWSCAFDASEGHVIMSMVSSKYEQAAFLIVQLAEKHGLVCFDPISGMILTAPDGIHIKRKLRWWRFWN